MQPETPPSLCDPSPSVSYPPDVSYAPSVRNAFTALLYGVALAAASELYLLLSGYTAFAQSMATLWPVLGLVTVLLLSLASALLLVRGIPLGALMAAQLFAAGWWLVTLHLRHASGVGNHERLWQWQSLLVLGLSLLPPLLGYALLRRRMQTLRNRRQPPDEPQQQDDTDTADTESNLAARG